MWLLSLRDLVFRRRRMVIAVLVTALVFGMALMFDGLQRTVKTEPRRIVAVFGADGWLVARGARGPLTTSQVIPEEAVDEARDAPGVTRADPVVVSRTIIGDTDVNLIGYRPGGLGTPDMKEGRALRGRGEAVISEGLDADVGDTIVVGPKRLRVVGVGQRLRYGFGTPSVLVSVRDAQDVVFGGQPLVMAAAYTGREVTPPAGLRVVDNGQAVSDVKRPIDSGIQTLVFMDVLLWLIAAGIIGAIVYLSVLERVRDFAVLKATGAPNSMLVGGLIVQSVILALIAALVGVIISKVLSRGLPFPAEITGAAILQLLGVSVVVGLLASLVGFRRVVGTDPALAFGGA